jgi:hypothetical protein
MFSKDKLVTEQEDLQDASDPLEPISIEEADAEEDFAENPDEDEDAEDGEEDPNLPGLEGDSVDEDEDGPSDDEDDDDEEEDDSDPDLPNHLPVNVAGRTRSTTSGKKQARVRRALKKLETRLAFAARLDPAWPQNYKAVANHPTESADWKEAIAGEIQNFINRDTWRIVDRTEVHPGQKALKSRWVFVKKDDKAGGVRFKAWFVVKGFGQVPGVDFTESYSPVANDTTI